MNDLFFTLLAVVAVCATAIVLFRGHWNRLSTADHAQIDELRERVRVLEQIVTDRGMDTAAQIEALRHVSKSRLGKGD
jgi:hypothetical protein